MKSKDRTDDFFATDLGLPEIVESSENRCPVSPPSWEEAVELFEDQRVEFFRRWDSPADRLRDKVPDQFKM